MVTQRVRNTINARRLAGPHRAVDWRDQEAFDLVVENRAPSPRLHDGVVTLLANFYRRRGDCRTAQERDRLAKMMPHVQSAVNLKEQAPEGVRCVLEALVLANQPRELIATRIGVTEESIEFFEQAFFDIRGRLAESQFIIDNVIRLREAGADGERFASAVVKMLSYYTGPACIDLVMVSRGDEWTSIREVTSKLANRTRILLDLDTVRSESIADSRLKQETRRAIEAIEGWNGQYGDESVPRTEEQLVEAKRHAVDKLLMDRIRGGVSQSREAENVQ